MTFNFKSHCYKRSLSIIVIKTGNFTFVFPRRIANMFACSVFFSSRIAIVQLFSCWRNMHHNSLITLRVLTQHIELKQLLILSKSSGIHFYPNTRVKSYSPP